MSPKFIANDRTFRACIYKFGDRGYPDTEKPFLVDYQGHQKVEYPLCEIDQSAFPNVGTKLDCRNIAMLWEHGGYDEAVIIGNWKEIVVHNDGLYGLGELKDQEVSDRVQTYGAYFVSIGISGKFIFPTGNLNFLLFTEIMQFTEISIVICPAFGRSQFLELDKGGKLQP